MARRLTSTRSIECALCGDFRVAQPMAVVIASAARRLAKDRTIRFTIVDCGLRGWQMKRLQACGIRARSSVRFVQPSQDRLAKCPTCRHFSAAANARLFLSSLLPDSDRVIYLDSDVVVSRDLSALWDMDLGGLPLAACANSSRGEAMQDRTAMAYAADSLAAPHDPYFNSGLLVADLRSWRELAVESQAESFFERFGDKTVCPDQDALNYAFSGRYKRLEEHWNVQCPSTASKPFVQERLAALSEGRGEVCHFVGAFKPWNGGPLHPFMFMYLTEMWRAQWLRLREWPRYLLSAMTPPRLQPSRLFQG